MFRNGKKYSAFTSFHFLACLEAAAGFSEVTYLSFENVQREILTPTFGRCDWKAWEM